MMVSIPYGKGKVEEINVTENQLSYQFPMGKVKKNVRQVSTSSALAKYQFPMGKVKMLRNEPNIRKHILF